MLVPHRTFSSPEYRYGFQGQEKDDEIKGNGNSIGFANRMHDPRVGRFLSIDPLYKEFPGLSTYSFAANRPIDGIDLKGLSWTPTIDDKGKVTGFEWTDAAPDPTNNIYKYAVYFNDPGDYTVDKPKSNKGRKQMGSAKVTAYGLNKTDVKTFDATTYPGDIQKYATSKPGVYWAVLGMHKGKYPALRILDGGKIPTMNNFNPKFKERKGGGMFGQNVHSAWPDPWNSKYFNKYKNSSTTGYNSKGKNPTSEGCFLVDPSKYLDFLSVFAKKAISDLDRKVDNIRVYLSPFTSISFDIELSQKNKLMIIGRKRMVKDKIGVGVYRYNPTNCIDLDKDIEIGPHRELVPVKKYIFPEKKDKKDG